MSMQSVPSNQGKIKPNAPPTQDKGAPAVRQQRTMLEVSGTKSSGKANSRSPSVPGKGGSGSQMGI